MSAEPLQLTYKVSHSMFGDIGTYTNTIEPAAGGVTVQTQAHFAVNALGVPLYHEDSTRTEQWQGDRLVAFHGLTTRGNNSMKIDGQARGNSFVINSPDGVVAAPATVHPANPWSANFIGSSTMMAPDTGKLEQVRVTGGEETEADIDGRKLPARKYDIHGQTRYSVWIDDHGVPIKFIAEDNTGKVTFTLASCNSCNSQTVSYQGAAR